MSPQTEPQAQENEQALAPISARFVAEVQRQFSSELSDELTFTDYEKTLAQHMFLKVDAALATFEAKRLEESNSRKTPFLWKNVNLERLALDTVHHTSLGLDALLPNHISPIPYWNKAVGKYDLSLRVGYAGKDYCAQTMALDPPLAIEYHLVHANDRFEPRPRTRESRVEGYEFEIPKPFDRGYVVGGFGYIVYDDERKNRLVIVTPQDFKRAEAAAKSSTFWNNHRQQMQHKTVVLRVTATVTIDPRKVNAKSYAYVTDQEREVTVEEEMAEEMAGAANAGDVIDITPAPEGSDEKASVGTDEYGPGF